MYTCNFCNRKDFPSRQSFNAHCRWCALYLQHKQQQAALGTSLRDAVPKAQPHPTPASPIAPPPPCLPRAIRLLRSGKSYKTSYSRKQIPIIPRRLPNSDGAEYYRL